MWLNVCSVIVMIIIIVIAIIIIIIVVIVIIIITRLARDVAERVQQGKLVVLIEGEGRSSSPMVIKLLLSSLS